MQSFGERLESVLLVARLTPWHILFGSPDGSFGFGFAILFNDGSEEIEEPVGAIASSSSRSGALPRLLISMGGLSRIRCEQALSGKREPAFP